MTGTIISARTLEFLFTLMIVTVHSTRADSIIPVDPSATYLLTNSDPGAENTAPINLSLFGLRPGDHITLQALGDLCYYSPDCSRFNVPPPYLRQSSAQTARFCPREF